MTIRKEDIVSFPEGGIVKCFSCVAHGRILLELIGKPSSAENRLMAVAMAHEVATKGKHDILLSLRHQPRAE
jgi:hypothetical protein